jgi:hypothetical protein
MNFEFATTRPAAGTAAPQITATASDCGARVPRAMRWGLNSKFKIENSKFESLKTAMRQSEKPTRNAAMPFPETV